MSFTDRCSGSNSNNYQTLYFYYNDNSSPPERLPQYPRSEPLFPRRPPQETPPVLYKYDGTPLPAPKNHPGPNRNVKISYKQVGDGEAVICEHPAGFFTGHYQRIEVLEGPDFLVGWASSECSGKSAKEARRKCYAQLESKIKEYNSNQPAHGGGLLNKEVSVFNQQELITECPEFNNVKEQSEVALEILDNTTTFISHQDEPITTSFQIDQQQSNVPPPEVNQHNEPPSIDNESPNVSTHNKNLGDLEDAMASYLKKNCKEKSREILIITNHLEMLIKKQISKSKKALLSKHLEKENL